VAPEIRREHVEAVRPPLLRELAEAPSVGRDAVQADERRGGRVAPFVEVEAHQAREAVRRTNLMKA
jgi:hypothetical protein